MIDHLWPQTYTPVSDSLPLSALVAALPVFVVLALLGIFRKPAWIAALSGLGTAAAVAFGVYHMPAPLIASICGYGAAYGFLPIGWIVFTAHPALPPDRRDRKIRNHQGLHRQPHRAISVCRRC